MAAIKSRAVPSRPFPTCIRQFSVDGSGERRHYDDGRQFRHMVRRCRPEVPAANKPKALSAARGD
jgi:hypothetical protein